LFNRFSVLRNKLEMSRVDSTWINFKNVYKWIDDKRPGCEGVSDTCEAYQIFTILLLFVGGALQSTCDCCHKTPTKIPHINCPVLENKPIFARKLLNAVLYAMKCLTLLTQEREYTQFLSF